MHYVDKYTGSVLTNKNEYQLVGVVALWIAAKLDRCGGVPVDTILQSIDYLCPPETIMELEKKMLKKLKFKLNPPTLYQYMVLLVSLFVHFQDSHFLGIVNFGKGSYLWNNVFWTLDLVHLEDSYKPFQNKEKVCLAIMYLNMKK
jgi:hypothetical protein